MKNIIYEHISREPELEMIMRMKNRTSFLAIACFLWLPMTMMAEQKESFTWLADSGKKKVQMLSSAALNSKGQSAVFLFDFTGDTKFLIRVVADAGAGTIRYRIEDDSGDWWLENSISFNVSFDSMKELSDYSPEPGAGKLTHAIRSEGLEIARTYEYQMYSGREISEDFTTYVTNDEQALLFAEKIPRKLREAILFLYHIEDREATWRYDELIGIIANWIEKLEIEPSLASAEMEWELESSHEWGLGTMVTPEELEFTSRFKSIDNADPLAGFRPEELFPEE